MIEIINGIFCNRMLFIVGVTYGVPITIALITLFFVKSSRNERGRAIIGKASIIAMIVFIPAGNEPSGRACTDSWRMPRGSNTPPLEALQA